MVQSLPNLSAPLRFPPPSVAQLPQLGLPREQTPLNVGWQSVWAGPPSAPVTALGGKSPKASPAGALLDALDELLNHRDPHVVFRVAVQLCRDRLGLRAPALLLLDSSGEYLSGTWRAGQDGSLIDERDTHLKLGLLPREAETRARSRTGSWTAFSEQVFPHVYSEGAWHGKFPWTVLTPIFGRDRLIGFLENVGEEADGGPQEAVQTRTALFCRALGGVLDDIERRARSWPWESVLTCAPYVPKSPRQVVVAKVLRALHDDASVSSRTLAVQLGVSTSHLSTAFHEQMGLSLTRYRNRFRIERFFTECDPCGGNLLQAALYAGFGSYPQFHRVFRELLDATPRDYLIPAA